MINGAFGAGKTSLANILIEKIPNSMIYDPEEVGFMVRKITNGIREANEETDDFQDIELWRVLVIDTARRVKEKYNKNLIVPMTIYKSQNFDYIKEGFRKIDDKTFHFCLMASYDMIHKRLEMRGDMPGSWAFQKTEKCLEAFKDKKFSTYIDTEDRSIDEACEKILEIINKRE